MSANVVVAVDDARMRLVANLPDADARTALDADFSTLDKALLDNRVADARTALATIYSRLASMRVAGSGGTLVDTPDAAAIRLDLVPTATALGVVAQ
ncbi:MAG TPA: hypothetical protein VG818_07215 [Gemmatimonadaceae bacterium]|nr:hypothetical protein [Gemmatimonadaceae bacterium]